MKTLIFLGAPGCGKGTQAAMVKEELDIAHISTGDILREAVAKQTAAGVEAKNYMDRGDLVPDEIMIAIIKDRIVEKDCEKGFILDGFPRTLPQASALDQMLADSGKSLSKVVYINVPQEILMKRILGRQSCPACKAVFNKYFNPSAQEDVCDACKAALVTRSDDNEESVKNRLTTFNNNTFPLIDFYKDQGKLVDINGDQEILKIKEAIIAAV